MPENDAQTPSDPLGTSDSSAAMEFSSPPAVSETPDATQNIPPEQHATNAEISPEKIPTDLHTSPADDIPQEKILPETSSVPSVGDLQSINVSDAEKIQAQTFRGSEGRSKALRKRITKRDVHLKEIIEYAQTHNIITNDAIEKHLRISDSTASRYLKQLVEEKSLVRIGKGRSIAYHIAR